MAPKPAAVFATVLMVARAIGVKHHALEAIHPIGPHGFRVIVIDSEGNRVGFHAPVA